MNQCHQFTTPYNRRHWLQSTACGFGALAFQAFAQRIARAAGSGLERAQRPQEEEESPAWHSSFGNRVSSMRARPSLAKGSSLGDVPTYADVDGQL